MRILFLSHRLPYPPNKGDKIRSFHEIRHLARRHQIHLLSFADPDEGGVPGRNLGDYCSAVEVFPLNRYAAGLRSVLGLFGNRPLTLSYFRSSALARRVDALIRTSRFDAVMVCGSAMAQYLERAVDIPRLLDLVDVDSVKWAQYAEQAPWFKKLVWQAESRRLSRYESYLVQTFDWIVVTTAHEAETLASISKSRNSAVVRNGIELDDSMRPLGKAEAPTLVFMGQMDYFPNVDGVEYFARTILPRLRARFADLRFLIVGRSPTPEIRRLSRLPGVTVTGEVEDVGPYLAESWVFVAPLRIARGVQNKVLEAMAMGLPVVVSSRVMAGLADGGFRDGEDLLVGTDDRQFQAAVTRLLADENMRADLAANALSKLRASYSWTKNLQTLDQQLEDLVRNFKAAPLGSEPPPAAPHRV